MYLECRSHTPIIKSYDEVGQHHYDLPMIRKIIARRAEFSRADEMDYSSRADMWEPGRGYFFINAVNFLLDHPECEIGIRDEFDREHPLTEENET